MVGNQRDDARQGFGPREHADRPRPCRPTGRLGERAGTADRALGHIALAALEAKQRALASASRELIDKRCKIGGARCAIEPRADHLGAEGFDLRRSEEHTSELQSLMRISYAVFCLKK